MFILKENKSVEIRPKLVVLDANFYWAEQLFSACAPYADVLLLRPVDFRSFKKRYGGYFIDTKPREVNNYVWEQRICCLPGWLFHYWPLTQIFLKNVIRRFQDNSPLIFAFSYPYYSSLVQALGAYSIYYAIDDYQDYWPGRQAQTIEQERQAVSIASLTLCTAKYRFQHFKKLYPEHADQMAHIPHGCSPKFIADQVLTTPKSLPVALQRHGLIQSRDQIAGYIGALNYRFDFQFLATVAEQMPDITFTLGGKPPAEVDGSAEWWKGVERCKLLSNVMFIGFVPHEQIGTYLQSFDVLLMLYSDCNFNKNACPTKLWDYMGTSRPIVANSTVPEVQLWKDFFHVVETPKQYVMAIRKALAEPSWKSNERLKIAKANTWREQAFKLHNIIQMTAARGNRASVQEQSFLPVNRYG